MKKIIAILTLLFCAVIAHAADQYTVTEQPAYKISTKDTSSILNILHTQERTTGNLDFVDYLEEIADQMEPEDMEHIVNLLLELSKKNNLLHLDTLKKAVAIHQFDPKSDPTKVHETISSDLPGSHPIWECSKRFVVAGCVSVCTVYVLTKAWNDLKKPDNAFLSSASAFVRNLAQVHIFK